MIFHHGSQLIVEILTGDLNVPPATLRWNICTASKWRLPSECWREAERRSMKSWKRSGIPMYGHSGKYLKKLLACHPLTIEENLIGSLPIYSDAFLENSKL